MSEVVEVEGRWCVVPTIKVNNSLSKPTSLLITSPTKTAQRHLIKQQQRQPSPDSVAVVDDVLAFTSNQDDDDDSDFDDDDDDNDIFQDSMEEQHHNNTQPPPPPLPPPPPPPPPRCSKIRFADEVGKPLTEVHVIEPTKGSSNTIVILLMSPQDRVFEFLHVEYPNDDDPNTTCGVVLEQLPHICNNPVFKNTSDKSFTTLSKTKNSYLLNNTTPIRDYDLDEGELLLAVLDGYDVNEMASFALPLLLNGRIQKAVKHAKRTKRGLKTITGGTKWKQQQQQQQQSVDSQNGRIEARDDGPTSTSSSHLSLSPSAGTDGTSKAVDHKTNDNQDSTANAMETNDDDGSSHRVASKRPTSPKYSESDDDLEAVPNLDFTEEGNQDDLMSANYEECSKIDNSSSNTATSVTTTASCTSPFLHNVSNEHESSNFEDEVPDLDDDDESTWRLPELTDYIGGKEGVEKVMFYVHAMSILSAAGALIRTWVR